MDEWYTESPEAINRGEVLSRSYIRILASETRVGMICSETMHFQSWGREHHVLLDKPAKFHNDCPAVVSGRSTIRHVVYTSLWRRFSVLTSGAFRDNPLFLWYFRLLKWYRYALARRVEEEGRTGFEIGTRNFFIVWSIKSWVYPISAHYTSLDMLHGRWNFLSRFD